MSLDQATKELQAALAKLREGHALISRQIATLESFLSSVGSPAPKRRGRPPKAAAAPAPAAKKAAKGAQVITTKSGVKRRKANWSPAAREAARKRMQEYWAQRRRKG